MTSDKLPKLIAFDLDYTLWPLWIDGYESPFRRNGNALGEVYDEDDGVISFYPDVPQILHRLRSAGCLIAACSRTEAPDLAREALSLLLLPPNPEEKDGSPVLAVDAFDLLEIYPGSKLQHFRKLHKDTGLPYSEMLFFDDEIRNKEVAKLGVTFCLVTQGLDTKVFEKGLAQWQKNHAAE